MESTTKQTLRVLIMWEIPGTIEKAYKITFSPDKPEEARIYHMAGDGKERYYYIYTDVLHGSFRDFAKEKSGISDLDLHFFLESVRHLADSNNHPQAETLLPYMSGRVSGLLKELGLKYGEKWGVFEFALYVE